MSDYSELTKFIPALTVERIGEWVMDGDTPRVEYWDVVFRFCDAVEAFCENNPEYNTEYAEEDADRPHRIVAKLLHAIRAESKTPGLLYGYLANGTVREWLEELKTYSE